MSVQTTQAAFSALRDHVAEGTRVLFPSGEVLTIRSDMRGWRVLDESGRQLSDSNLQAFGVECFIVARG